MGEILNREFQYEILKCLADVYPSSLSERELPQVSGNSLKAHVRYLHEHGLVSSSWYNLASGNALLGETNITAKGLDFLQDDGGLGAILNVVTVRLDDETVKALMVKHVEKQDADRERKNAMIEVIKKLPAEAVKRAGTRLIEKGLDEFPNLLDKLPDILS